MSGFAEQIRWDILQYAVGDGLDLGCGDARPHDWLVGIDTKAGQTNKGPNILHDATKLTIFAPESQDFIFSSYLLNELEDWPTVLKLWWSKLKPDGYLILFLPVTSDPKQLVDAMLPLKPWQMVEARQNGDSFFQVYRKCDGPHVVEQPDPEKTVAVIKLGAHGDALWASSVLNHLKEQGFYVILYTQETGEEVLRHDPHIDRMIRFESRVPMQELGELFAWMEKKYEHARILVECVEGTLLPSPAKIQYHHPLDMRHRLTSMNYVEAHHRVARVPLEPRVKFYPSDEEKAWANKIRSEMTPFVVVMVPNGSSCTKYWPYSAELAERLLQREDVTVVMLGDTRNCEYEAHPRFHKIGTTWNVRQAMTFCQLANVVVGQETGLLNCVSHEKDVRKVVLLTHSSVENLTRDWPNVAAIRTAPPCAVTDGVVSGCHRLHYSYEWCTQDESTKAAKCQAMISVDMVLKEIEPAIQRIEAAA